MKLTLSLWVLAIAWFLAPAAVAGQQSDRMGGGKRQDLTPSFLDVPIIPAQETPIVLAQAATPAVGSQPDYIVNMCKETESTGDPSSAMRTIDPAGMLATYMQNHNNRTVTMEMLAAIKTTLLEGTTHGKISSVIDNTGRPWYAYDSIPDYVGNDRAVFLAEFEGKVYKIVLELHVFMTVGENAGNTTCPEPQLIKVTKPSSGASGSGAGYDLSSISVTFADLAGGALGQTVDSNITLDTNAAGSSTALTTQIVTGPAHGVLTQNADGSYTYTPDANYAGLSPTTVSWTAANPQ